MYFHETTKHIKMQRHSLFNLKKDEVGSEIGKVETT